MCRGFKRVVDVCSLHRPPPPGVPTKGVTVTPLHACLDPPPPGTLIQVYKGSRRVPPCDFTLLPPRLAHSHCLSTRLEPNLCHNQLAIPCAPRLPLPRRAPRGTSEIISRHWPFASRLPSPLPQRLAGTAWPTSFWTCPSVRCTTHPTQRDVQRR